jgi:Icc-related predicted phosphoesterase
MSKLVFNAQGKHDNKQFKDKSWDETKYDAVVVAGDLNYRLYVPLSRAHTMMQKDLYDSLFATC